jgi:hypothetical protein
MQIVSCHTADSKPVKQEVNGTVILPPLVFPALTLQSRIFIVVLSRQPRSPNPSCGKVQNCEPKKFVNTIPGTVFGTLHFFVTYELSQ